MKPKGQLSAHGMPLETADGRHLQKQPLAASVVHARLREANFHDPGRVKEDLCDGRRPARADFTKDAFGKVEKSGPDDAFEVEGEKVSLAIPCNRGKQLFHTHNRQDS